MAKPRTRPAAESLSNPEQFLCVLQVMIDSQGLMKVMHMITVHAAGDATQRATQGTTQVRTCASLFVTRWLIAQANVIDNEVCASRGGIMLRRACWRERVWFSSRFCQRKSTAQNSWTERSLIVLS